MKYTTVLLALTGVVHAGSHIFQPKITRYDHLEIDHRDEEVHRRIIRDLYEPPPIESHQIDKRYLIKNQAAQQPWPNNQIRYCFASADDKTALFDNIKDAINRWWWAGLDAAVYSFVEVSDSECQSRRSSVLVIGRGTLGGGHSATLGFRPADASVGFLGPSLTLDDSDWGGYDNKVATFAHELGHVWGLFHEHQNPSYWKKADAYSSADLGEVFGNDEFNCQNINGYDEAAERARADYGDIGPEYMCHSMNYAIQYKFGGTDFLPWLPSTVLSHGGHTVADVDWYSIMIYNSYSGSKNGQPVLTGPNGKIINQNHYPSVLDVMGINRIYSAPPLANMPLLNTQGSTANNAYRAIYSQSRGDKGC